MTHVFCIIGELRRQVKQSLSDTGSASKGGTKQTLFGMLAYETLLSRTSCSSAEQV